MSLDPIIIAYEDALSGAILKRVLSEYAPNIIIRLELSRGGFGYLKTNAPKWNRAARNIPVLLLTDLDQKTCPASLINEWVGEPKHPHFLFRVAVREVEAWLLADRENFAAYLNISKDKVPLNPESNQDPKALLLRLVAKSRKRRLKLDLLPVEGGTARQGPNYNEGLIRYVTDHWDVSQAAKNATSLERMIRRLERFP